MADNDSAPITLDLSQSIPVPQAKTPAAAPTTPAPASAPSAAPAAAAAPSDVQLDMSQSMPVDHPSVWETIKNQFNQPVRTDPDEVEIQGAKELAEHGPDYAAGIGKQFAQDVESPIRLATGGAVKLPQSLAVDPNNPDQRLGSDVETALLAALGPEAAEALMKGMKLWDLSAKYPEFGKFLQVVKDHPWLSKTIGTALEGTATGGTIGAMRGSETGRAWQGAKSGAKTGAEIGAAVGAGGATLEGTNLLRNPFLRDVVQGEGASQAPAQGAMRTAAETVTPGPSPESLRTAMDASVNKSYSAAKDLYRAVDQTTGTDLKALADKLEAKDYQVLLSPDGSPEEAKLLEQRQTLQNQIDDAKAAARGNLKGDAAVKLQQADAEFTRASAMRDVQKVFKNPNIVSGNTAMGTPETVNVDSAIKAMQKLQDSTKFGAPRLEQALGKDSADALLKSLYDAQRQGVTALTRQQWALRLAKYGLPAAGTVGGVLYEFLKK